MGFGGGGGGGETRTTTTQELAPEQRELLKGVIPIAKRFLNRPPQQFEGSSIVGFDPAQVQGQETLLRATQEGGGLGQAIQGANQASQFLTSGAVLDPSTNPALAAAIQGATRPISENLTQNILPNIRGGAALTNTVGGSRQGIAEGLAAQGTQRQIGDTAAQLQNQAYQTGLGALVSGLQASPETARLNLLPGQVQSAVGAERQQLDQALRSEEVQKFMNEQMIPFLAAQDVAALAFGIGGGSATTQASVPTAQTSPLQGLLGGAGLLSLLF